MLDEDGGGSAASGVPAHRLEGPLHVEDVLILGRLVENEERGTLHERRSHSHALDLAG